MTTSDWQPHVSWLAEGLLTGIAPEKSFFGTCKIRVRTRKSPTQNRKSRAVNVYVRTIKVPSRHGHSLIYFHTQKVVFTLLQRSRVETVKVASRTVKVLLKPVKVLFQRLLSVKLFWCITGL